MKRLKYKIKRLYIENVKRIKIVEVIPKGNVIEIAGKNAQGKSSILDSIKYVLGGKEEIPIKPIREGEKSAQIVLETEDFTVVRSWTADNKTYFKVHSNTNISPQKFLDEKISKISFDPVAFLSMSLKGQTKLLRQVTGLDTSKLEADRLRLYDLRTIIGREVNRLKVFLKELGKPTYDLPDTEISSKDLLDELEKLSSRSAERNKKKIAIVDAENLLAGIDKEISSRQAELRELEIMLRQFDKERIQAMGRIRELKSELSKTVGDDPTPIHGELKIIEEKNKSIRENQQISKVQNELGDKETEYNDHTKQIDDITTEIENRILNTKFPLEGLSVKDDGILYNDIPISQSSQSEGIKIGLAIAESLNDELQIILVKDASLLDKASMKGIVKYAKEKDCQIWVERVEPTMKDAIIIEDGGIINQ